MGSIYIIKNCSMMVSCGSFIYTLWVGSYDKNNNSIRTKTKTKSVNMLKMTLIHYNRRLDVSILNYSKCTNAGWKRKSEELGNKSRISCVGSNKKKQVFKIWRNYLQKKIVIQHPTPPFISLQDLIDEVSLRLLQWSSKALRIKVNYQITKQELCFIYQGPTQELKTTPNTFFNLMVTFKRSSPT